ncbi:MAG: hypothetical protein QXU18_14545 [Thermoplasmatales archaeon]
MVRCYIEHHGTENNGKETMALSFDQRATVKREESKKLGFGNFRIFNYDYGRCNLKTHGTIKPVNDARRRFS